MLQESFVLQNSKAKDDSRMKCTLSRNYVEIAELFSFRDKSNNSLENGLKLGTMSYVQKNILGTMEVSKSFNIK